MREHTQHHAQSMQVTADSEMQRLFALSVQQGHEIERLKMALASAEAALADIGDADREPGDDLAWCEARAAQALPAVRAALTHNTNSTT